MPKDPPAPGGHAAAPETPYQRGPRYPAWYRTGRFQVGSGPRTDRAERRVIRRLLALADGGAGPWLDVPSGTGRLTGELPGPVVAVDREPGMLRAAASPDRGVTPRSWRVCASAHRLPFADRSFTGVLCVRLLQHIPAAEERVVILRELARVTREVVIVTFFDAGTLPAWRRRRRQRRGGRVGSRGAIPRSAMAAEAAAAGLRVERFQPIRWRLSEQCFALLRQGSNGH